MEQHTLKNVNNCLNTKIYPYLETFGGQSSNLCLNAIHFFNTRVNQTSVAALDSCFSALVSNTCYYIGQLQIGIFVLYLTACSHMSPKSPSDMISMENFLPFQIAIVGKSDKHVLFSRLCKRHFKGYCTLTNIRLAVSKSQFTNTEVEITTIKVFQHSFLG